jgi:hypothetical protein
MALAELSPQIRATAPAVVRLALSKRAVTRVLLLSIVAIHLLNLPAVWLRYEVAPTFLRGVYVAIFSVSSEGKLPTWYSAVALLICAVLLGAIAAARDGDPFRRHWSALAVIFGLMSLDEATAIHEMLSQPLRARLNTSGPLFFAWVIPAMAFLVILALAYARFMRALPRRTGGLFLLSGALYIAGALGMEMVGAQYADVHGATLAYGVLSTLEEVFEMSGIALFIYSLLDYLERRVACIEVPLQP